MPTIEQLVDRFEVGNSFTVQEFIDVLSALRRYADLHDAFDDFSQHGLEWARTLDPNTVLITLEERDEVMIPVATSGLIIPSLA